MSWHDIMSGYQGPVLWQLETGIFGGGDSVQLGDKLCLSDHSPLKLHFLCVAHVCIIHALIHVLMHSCRYAYMHMSHRYGVQISV